MQNSSDARVVIGFCLCRESHCECKRDPFCLECWCLTGCSNVFSHFVRSDLASSRALQYLCFKVITHFIWFTHNSSNGIWLMKLELFRADGHLNSFVNFSISESFVFIKVIFDTSPPSATYTHHRTGSELVQEMARRLFGARPLPEPMLPYCQLVPRNKSHRHFLVEILTFSFKKMHLKVSSAKWRPFCARGDGLGFKILLMLDSCHRS